MRTSRRSKKKPPFIPAKAGIQHYSNWVPAFALVDAHNLEKVSRNNDLGNTGAAVPDNAGNPLESGTSRNCANPISEMCASTSPQAGRGEVTAVQTVTV